MTEALLKYEKCKLIFISPRELIMPRFLIEECEKASATQGTSHEEGSRIEDYISHVDVLYMTRIQTERLEGGTALAEKLRSIYRLEAEC